MYIALNPTGTLYKQIYRHFVQRIRDGSLQEGTKLPSIRNLARDQGVSINTINDAYYQLEMEGYIRAKEKVGFYVCDISHLAEFDTKRTNIATLDAKQPALYDFTYGGVDTDAFPYRLWRKILKDILSKESFPMRQTGAKGYPPLRDAIARHLRNSRGVSVHSNQIVISAGTEHLFSQLKELFPSSTAYAFENPGYPWSRRYFTYGLDRVVSMDQDDSGATLDAIQNVKEGLCLLTPTHQFPLGTIMPVERKLEFLQWADQHDHRYILEDDYDGDFKYKGRPIPTLKSMDRKDRVIYLGSFSKTLFPSLRASYMILPKKLSQSYDQIFAGFGCPCSLIVQMALTCFIDEGHYERHLNRMTTIYGKKNKAMTQALSSLPSIEATETTIGTTLTFRLKESIAEETFLTALEKHGIALSPISSFYSEKPLHCRQYLLSFAEIPPETMKRGLTIFADILETLQSK